MYLFLVTAKDNYIIWFYFTLLCAIFVAIIFMYNEFEPIKIDFLKICTYGIGIGVGVALPITKYCTNGFTKTMMAIVILGLYFMVAVYNAMSFQIIINEEYANKIEAINESIKTKYTITSTAVIKKFTGISFSDIDSD